MKLNFKMLLLVAAIFTMGLAVADDFLNGGGNGGNNGASSASSVSSSSSSGSGGSQASSSSASSAASQESSQASSAASSSSNGSGGSGGTTGGNGDGCTRTQGYWGSSPAGQARLIELVGMSGMMLGNVNYSASQLDDILDQPVQGNAVTNLAHQLIAAKLNVLNGADDSEIADEIAAADALIGNRVVRPVGNAYVAPGSALGQQMIGVAGELDDYNNGELNVPHCFSL